ncbi:replication-associated recombination protein A [Riemerella anatipestifer]|uniref:replication-associated recombination protein A n=1 Tax=Riemerella anatipestifer TaxID=34085 RepID=UPI0009B6F3E5|nr:replication-associated recombination protein A [Riemerella anatipestifer]MCO7331210.1 replication-associated recombination protein A [Riemerella anatipestifer]MCO7350319.1 replication-associated recombination protein A [Riemerella anatipestifer]MCU7583045.1 replication-associated recombination protein A [Riemerella anatipestifer]MCW0492097.1 replication-associated recombination protein A [Riemerella anatipestifer]MDD1551080.1 replication-associated recombination protein A [Riemerella anatip
MNSNIPLAEKLRPKTLDEMLGQEHLTGKDGTIRKMLETDRLNSLILWGPPGTGKTTLAEILSEQSGRKFFKLSAVSSGVKEVREVIDEAKKQHLFSGKSPILFIDEIHRFNKSQQDSLLHAVEKGWVILIGATTENPSFEVVSALLSRSQVYILKPLSYEKLEELATIAVARFNQDENTDFTIENNQGFIQYSGGDARKLINSVEWVLNQYKGSGQNQLSSETILKVLQETIPVYDKNGEQHYDVISAFIKSIRGSDVNAALYWLGRMLVGGEDIKFIARRLLILAAEDIGLANPNALTMANSCFQSVNVIGYPESRIILSECVIYLAASPKSNSAYQAINEALALAKKTAHLPVPLHLRNAPTKLMKEMDYGKDYRYAHAYEGSFVSQEFFPEELSGVSFYRSGDNATERKIKEQISKKWGDKY